MHYRLGSIILAAAMAVSVAATVQAAPPQSHARLASSRTQEASVHALRKLNANPKWFPYFIDYINYGKKIFVNPHMRPFTLPRGHVLSAGGWAIDAATKSMAGGVMFTVDDKIDFGAVYGGNRPDVAHKLGGRYMKSGFIITMRSSMLTPGSHYLRIKILSHDRKGYYEPLQKINFTVK